MRKRKTQTSAALVGGVLLVGALAGLLAGCGGADSVGGSSQLGDGSTREMWAVELLHSGSDRAEEPGNLADFERLELPVAMVQGATVIVYISGADGQTSPRRISRVNFDTSDVDGGNPVLRADLQAQRRDKLVREVADGAQRIPFSQATDVFGGVAAAKAFFDQYPPRLPKTFIAIGDELANRPTGCVLSSRDMSTPTLRAALLRVCSPVTPDLSGVKVQLVGAGYSTDDEIDSAVAQGLEQLLREYFAAAHARVVLYAPVLVAAGAGELPR